MTRHRWNPPRPHGTASRRRPRPAPVRAAGLACAILAAGCTGGDDGDAAPEPETTVTTTPIPELTERADPLPVVTPAPRDLRWLGPDVTVSPQVTIVTGPGTDDATVEVLREVMAAAGADDVTVTTVG
jgi:hypothetical protein